jgi:hypothetical protein
VTARPRIPAQALGAALHALIDVVAREAGAASTRVFCHCASLILGYTENPYERSTKQ